MSIDPSVDDAPSGAEAGKAYRAHLLICAGTGCVSNKSFKVRAALEEEIKKRLQGLGYIS